ncbi:MAG: DM13 domain-containing protein [Chitinophagaceae bacterium]|nr:DM13 domain-containing protein [Chitinophagaceae bacterium]
MKKHFYFLGIVFLFVLNGCTKTGSSSEPINEMIGNSGTPVTSAMAFTSANSYTVTGNVRVYQKDGKLILALENFKSSNGPDLRVYLSKEMQPVNFIELGRLKSVQGNQLYDIPGNPDFNTYKFAIIHCQQFNRVFGFASIK